MTSLAIKRLVVAAALFSLTVSASVSALVLHPANNPTSSPVDAVVGRWGSNASAVVVSSTHVITTRHQGGGVGTNVIIDGTTYVVAEVTNAPGSVDLRVARIETLGGSAAGLTDFVSIYTNTDEVGQTHALGGFGEGRGSDILSGPNVIGYDWDGATGTQRWGANKVTSTINDANVGAFTNDLLVATFEAPGEGGNPLGAGVAGEATIADNDSGGGWFINDGGTWKVAALSQAVENPDEALFDEELYGVRLSSYSMFINNTVPEPGSAALLLIAAAGLVTRRRRSA